MPGTHIGSPADGAPPDLRKRKREGDDGHQERIPQPPPPHSENGAFINYLSKAGPHKLPLISADSETFSSVLSLIKDYEVVLNRQESLAVNLGAKLTGPRLVRAMEALFEGGINVSPAVSPRSPFHDGRAASSWTPSWLEVVTFARSNPEDFTLTTTNDGRRVCHFVMNNSHVEISEDDWRLIKSGTIDRFVPIPECPLEEDEDAEIATLEILEGNVQVLIKQADEVARKARQLNYRLSGRKAAITSRRAPPQQQQPTRSLPGGGNPSNSSFQPVNQPQHARSGLTNPAYDLQSDLLQQFLGSGPPAMGTPSLPSPSEPPRRRNMAPISTGHPTPTPTGRLSPIQQDPGSNAAMPPENARTRPISDRGSPVGNIDIGPLIPIITTRIEKLSKGDEITPPCDRCRRLRITCVKNLTACQGCTKKHCKCNWKHLTDEEIALIRSSIKQQATSTQSTEADRDHEQTPEVEAAEGARVLRELSSRRHSNSFPPSLPYDQERGSTGGEIADRRFQGQPQHPNQLPPLQVAQDQHNLLSRMATIATAEAEARAVAGRVSSRGESVTRD